MRIIMPFVTKLLGLYISVPPSIRFCPYFYGIRLSDMGVQNVSWEYGN